MESASQKKKIMVVAGTRPEAVKMSPIMLELMKTPGAEPILCLTGQHREMLDQTLTVFGLKGDIDLNLMTKAQTLSHITSSILTGMDEVLKKVHPDWILIQGDTTTVMASALAAFYNEIKVGHVEAGLRSGNKWAPFPEEINRKVAGIVADLNFCPTIQAKENLLKENVPEKICYVTGNTVIDALHYTAALPFKLEGSPLEDIPFGKKQIITMTAHRRENIGKPLEDICSAVLKIAETFKDSIHIVYPVHLNPAVRDIVFPRLGHTENITLLDPLDYLPMVQLMKRSKLILTDSGGLQEEAPGLGIPVLVLREVTERPEGIATGNVRLVGSDPEKIFNETSKLLTNEADWKGMSTAVNPYGDGKSAARIVKLVMEN